ncbi:MAG: cohesin domain-containing protein [Blastocatellia bacterium]
MNTNTILRRFFAVFLSACLVMPGLALADGRSGKKDFKEGMKYEEMAQWDMAAQKFALAYNAEPNNIEFKLHYLRALEQASIMYVKRGDTLAEQKDYVSAYTAYRTAYSYNQGNEISRIKMERMLEIQKAEMNGGEPINYNLKTGNVRPTSNDVQIASRPRSRDDVIPSISFKSAKFKLVVNQFARQLGLNVVYDETVKEVDVKDFELENVTFAKALDILFKAYKYTFEQVDRRTILVYQDNTTNRPRFENYLVKTFYLGNINAQQARGVLTGMLPPGRQIAVLDNPGAGGGANNSNILLVKATAAELQLVQDIIDSIDKNKNEVVLDIEIFEVSHDSLLQIGNQIATDKGIPVTETRFDKDGKPVEVTLGTSASLANIGGLARGAFAIAGTTFSPFAGIGGLLGLPPTTLSLLQSKGNSKLLHKTQIHVLDGGQNTTKVGKKVPVSLGNGFGGGLGNGLGGFGGIGGGGLGAGATGQVGGIGAGINNGLGGIGGIGGGLGGFGFGGFGNNIQYQDVGLVIEAKPIITNEGYVEVQMKFETSDVVASGADSTLTPTFTQRSLSTVARIQDGVTSIVAGVNQEQKGDSRASIPVLGMVPILGRLFTTPRQTSSQSDIIITVTPHIVRSAGLKKEDYLARGAGGQQAGPSQSIEEVVNRAQVEEEGERRIIAQQMQPGVPLTTPAGSPNPQMTVPASQRTAGEPRPVVQPVNNPGAGNSARRPNSRPVINDQSLPQSTYTNSPSVSVPSQPDAPQPDPTPRFIQEARPETNGGGGQPGAPAGAPAKEGEQPPDLSQYMTQPEQPVPQAAVTSASRPEHVERAIAKMLAEERARKAEEAKNKTPKKPEPQPEFPKEYITPGPNQRVGVAAPKVLASAPSTAGVTFTLSPKPGKLQVGKSFAVTVEVNSQSQMSGANVALRFDEKRLRVKAVKDAGMFGSQPELSYDINNGNLVVRIKNAQNQPSRASGRMITVEFETLAMGETEIAFVNSDTKARIGSALTPASGNSMQVVISRDSVTSETK